jgi:hypothetical protein
MQPPRRVKSCHLQQNGGLEDIMLSEISQTYKTSATCPLSQVSRVESEYRIVVTSGGGGFLEKRACCMQVCKYHTRLD